MSDERFSADPIPKARAKLIADLDRASSRRESGLFRIEGWRALESALTAGVRLEDIVVRNDALTPDRIRMLQSASSGGISSVPPKGMARLTSVVQDQGVVATARMNLVSVTDVTSSSRILALDGVQDPGNVGTLIRTAAWFGIDAVIADNNTADFFNPKVVRAAAGGIWDVALVRANELMPLLSTLRSDGFTCFGADVARTESPDWRESARSVLVLGSEGHGLSEAVRSVLDGFVHVSGERRRSKGVESLNVATAGSILIARWAG